MIVYLMCYAASILFARVSLYALSGIVLILAALYLYFTEYKRTGHVINLRGLYSLGLVGGEGVSCLKLSYLQTQWSPVTWAVLFLAYMSFWICYEVLLNNGGKFVYRQDTRYSDRPDYKPIFLSVIIVTVLSVSAFITEATVLGYIPLLVRGVPHAYSVFHITGVHYITVSCVLVPSLAIVYFHAERLQSLKRTAIVSACALIALIIPILCVSRFQFVFALLMATFTYMSIQKKITIWPCIASVIVIIPIYILLTIARSHDVTYLNSIFEMKYNLPIWISQPYIYIANNFDNLNCLITELPAYTYGQRLLFPLWTFSGIKFLIPSLVQFPIYVTKAELTTVTLIYDAYYDFGIIGTVVFTGVLGGVSEWAGRKMTDLQNPIGYLLFAQLALYLLLSFFTTWFSNPTTWFYLVVTVVIYAFCNRRIR